MKVAVVSIAKNEEQFVKRWKESAQDADALYILDTGSSDNTVSIAKELGIKTYTADIQPWHFANARNFLLDMLPDDIDWIINLDLDEILIDGWRAELEKVANDGSITRVRYKYIWNWNPDGTPGVTYHGDKIVRRHTHRWKGACHEVNTVQPGYEELQTFCELQIHQHADNTKSRSSYLPLLLLDVEEDPENDRNVYYCARELFFSGRAEEAVAMFKRHLGLKSAVWAPERAWSMRYLAKLLPEEAEHWHLRACAEYPEGAEVWTDLATFYYSKAQWPGCFYAATKALNCTYSGNLYLTEPNAYGWWPNDLAALAAYQIGSYHLALKYGQTAVDLNPTDQRLKDNLFFYKKALTGVTVVIPTKSNIDGLTTLISALMSSDSMLKVVVVGDGTETKEMLQALPNSIIKTYVPRGSGISAMWNVGMQLANPGDHVLFLNDDVTINTSTVSGLIAALAEDSRIGLVCPKYAGDSDVDIVSQTTCRGRYDGTGGMAGFAMMLAADLVPHFRFDERMMWWYSDDDLVNWVNKKANRLCVISAKARCHHGHSVTITSNPPDNFNKQVEIDRQLFEQKWSA